MLPYKKAMMILAENIIVQNCEVIQYENKEL